MKERGILFNADMVNAILRDDKTMTRRVLKPQPPQGFCHGDVAAITNGDRWAISRSSCNTLIRGAWPADPEPGLLCPLGKVGDRLYVRETLKRINRPAGVYPKVMYADETDYDLCTKNLGWKTVPSIHTFRHESRILLEITRTRLQLLNDISEEDAKAEGCSEKHLHGPMYSTAYSEFCTLWESINGPDSWDKNPWCWAISYRRINSN